MGIIGRKYVITWIVGRKYGLKSGAVGFGGGGT